MDTLFVLGVESISILREKWSRRARGESKIEVERLVERRVERRVARMLHTVYTSCYW